MKLGTYGLAVTQEGIASSPLGRKNVPSPGHRPLQHPMEPYHCKSASVDEWGEENTSSPMKERIQTSRDDILGPNT